jgi:hypothetical protein
MEVVTAVVVVVVKPKVASNETGNAFDFSANNAALGHMGALASRFGLGGGDIGSDLGY